MPVLKIRAWIEVGNIDVSSKSTKEALKKIGNVLYMTTKETQKVPKQKSQTKPKADK